MKEKTYSDHTYVIRTLNAIGILILMGVIIAAYYQEYSKVQTPCPLCFLQRLGMIGIATGAMMNLQFGVRVKHYVLSILSGLLGGVVAARQILLHICPGDPKFGYPVMGFGLYTWSFLVFCCAVLGLVLLLFLFKPEQRTKHPKNLLEKFAYFALVAVTLANCITVLQICNVGACPDPPWPPATNQSS